MKFESLLISYISTLVGSDTMPAEIVLIKLVNYTYAYLPYISIKAEF